MQGAGSIYFATLQGYVINETNLYLSLAIHACPISEVYRAGMRFEFTPRVLMGACLFKRLIITLWNASKSSSTVARFI